MVFDALEDEKKVNLYRIHRQEQDNPILDLAHSLADPKVTFTDFEKQIFEISETDERVILQLESWILPYKFEFGLDCSS